VNRNVLRHTRLSAITALQKATQNGSTVIP